MALTAELRVTQNTRQGSCRLSLVVLSVTVCAYFILSFMYSTFANYWPGPFVDYWIDIPNVEKYFNGTLTFHDLISAHANVHRLLIPRLLFIADYRFFAGTNTLLVCVSILCKVITLLLFNHMIKQETLQTRLLLNILLFAAILNAANISNVLHNSNMQWDLASIFSCLAIYFYSRDCHSALSTTRWMSLGLAILFFTGGLLSQAGALPVVFIFVFISLLNKKWIEACLSVLFMLLVLYLTFVVLPVNEPQNPTYESALVTFVVKLRYVATYVFKMFSGSIYFIDSHYFIFSWIILALLATSLIQAHKTKKAYNNIFLYLALFALLMMITIAAARVDFAPKTWPANRYQTNVLLFILTLILHSYFSAPIWFGDKHKVLLQNTILVFSITSFLITQYFLNNYGAIFGNKVFAAQAYMLTHGPNQRNGADLLPSQQALDRIAESDPFFKKHGFAWYSNKKNDALLLLPQDKTDFVSHCTSSSSLLKYNPVEDGEGLQFSTTLNTGGFHLLKTIPRNTYTVLDLNGNVVGYSYIYIDPDHQYGQREINGYVAEPNAKYIAEINHQGKTICLYSLDDNNESIQ